MAGATTVSASAYHDRYQEADGQSATTHIAPPEWPGIGVGPLQPTLNATIGKADRNVLNKGSSVQSGEYAMSENLDAVRRFWQALRSRNPDNIRAAVTSDVEWIAPPDNATAAALGITHHMIGPEAICRFMIDDFPRLFSNGMEVEIISIVADKDRVVFEQRQKAVLSNGRAFDLLYVFIFEVSGGQVRRIREYMDTHSGRLMVFGDEVPRAFA